MRIKYTKEILEPIVATSFSWAEVCKKLQIKPSTGSQSHIKKRVLQFGLDTTHFRGQGWSRGKIAYNAKPIEYYLVKGSTINSHKLKLRLISSGMKPAQCEICELTKWLGAPIVLELHHKNSDHFDNRLENLQILCPNCHSQLTRIRRGRPTAESTDLGTSP